MSSFLMVSGKHDGGTNLDSLRGGRATTDLISKNIRVDFIRKKIRTSLFSLIIINYTSRSSPCAHFQG